MGGPFESLAFTDIVVDTLKVAGSAKRDRVSRGADSVMRTLPGVSPRPSSLPPAGGGGEVAFQTAVSIVASVTKRANTGVAAPGACDVPSASQAAATIQVNGLEVTRAVSEQSARHLFSRGDPGMAAGKGCTRVVPHTHGARGDLDCG